MPIVLIFFLSSLFLFISTICVVASFVEKNGPPIGVGLFGIFLVMLGFLWGFYSVNEPLVEYKITDTEVYRVTFNNQTHYYVGYTYKGKYESRSIGQVSDSIKVTAYVPKTWYLGLWYEGLNTRFEFEETNEIQPRKHEITKTNKGEVSEGLLD